MDKNEKRPALFYNVVNGNGRKYMKGNVDGAVNKYNATTHPGIRFGELGHPDDVERFVSSIRPSHKIGDVESTDEGMFVEIEPLQNTEGKILTKMLEEDMVVFRPRMIGTVDEDGTVHITEIVSFDAISKMDDSYIEQQREYDERNKK
jgi:hypothetical protein